LNTRYGSVKAAAKIVVLLSWTALLLPVQAVAVALGLRLAKVIPFIYHRLNCRIIGIDIDVIGEPSESSPVLIVSNHSSYLDIVILSALRPVSFVAKQEVASWPLFGLLAKLQRSVFVVRRASRSAVHRDEITKRLEAGDDLVLFPEGTSSDGNRVLRFNSTFFAVAEPRVDSEPLTVQPLSIAYTGLKSLPLRRSMRPFFAWYGDMDLAHHMWAALALAPFGVTIEWHPPVTREQFPSRKAMALHCQSVVAAGLRRALCGRREAREHEQRQQRMTP